MNRIRRPASLVILVLLSMLTSPLSAGDVDVRLTGPKQSITVENPGPAVVPDVYIVGEPDRTAEPVRKTKGVTLDGVRLSETLLSESVLIVRPDGTGNWGYHTGFDIFREPQYQDGKRIEPRTLVEYDKWQYDPMEPVSRGGGDMNLLLLYSNRPLRPALYEIAFPPPIRIRTLKVHSNCDAIGKPGVRVAVRLFADRGRKQLLAEQHVGPDQSLKRFPVVFDHVNRHGVFLELSAESKQRAFVGLYFTMFEADLQTVGLKLPRLATGPNVLTLTDDIGSSHRARVVLRWTERPPAERIWDDLEDTLRWGGCNLVEGGPENGSAFTGRSFARATFPANGRDYSLNRSMPSLDLTGYNRLSIAMRAQQVAPMRAILVGIRNEKSRYQYVRPRPLSRWNFQTFDISRFQRDKVTAMNVYWMAIPGFDRPDEPCVYDVDTICLWQDDQPEPTASRELPPKIANYQSPHRAKQLPSRPIPPIQEWFPLGVYDGICSRSDKECEWLFDQMKRLHMNAVYVSNGGPEGLQRILPLAEQRGIRLVYQGGGEGAMYFEHLATPQARLRSLNKVIVPRAKEWLPKFRDRWGLAAWSLTEEIGPDLSRELTPYYQLVRELMPSNPPTVLHNNLKAAVVDLETNRPLVITHDFYPFFWSPRSGPSNPPRSLRMFRSRVSGYYKACRRHGASLWMMPQSWGAEESAPLDPPNYGYRTGMRTPQPGEIKQQGWLAIAEGATGIMFYATVATKPGQHHLWDIGWTETDSTRAAGELFCRVSRIAPLLCRLERDYKEDGFVKTSNPQVLAHSFVKRKGYAGKARYVVLASLDGFGPQEVAVSVSVNDKVFDMVERKEVTGQLNAFILAAGEGTVFLVGSQADFETDCRLIDGELRKWQ